MASSIVSFATTSRTMSLSRLYLFTSHLRQHRISTVLEVIGTSRNLCFHSFFPAKTFSRTVLAALAAATFKRSTEAFIAWTRLAGTNSVAQTCSNLVSFGHGVHPLPTVPVCLVCPEEGVECGWPAGRAACLRPRYIWHLSTGEGGTTSTLWRSADWLILHRHRMGKYLSRVQSLTIRARFHGKSRTRCIRVS